MWKSHGEDKVAMLYAVRMIYLVLLVSSLIANKGTGENFRIQLSYTAVCGSGVMMHFRSIFSRLQEIGSNRFTGHDACVLCNTQVLYENPMV